MNLTKSGINSRRWPLLSQYQSISTISNSKLSWANGQDVFFQRNVLEIGLSEYLCNVTRNTKQSRMWVWQTKRKANRRDETTIRSIAIFPQNGPKNQRRLWWCRTLRQRKAGKNDWRSIHWKDVMKNTCDLSSRNDEKVTKVYSFQKRSNSEENVYRQ